MDLKWIRVAKVVFDILFWIGIGLASVVFVVSTVASPLLEVLGGDFADGALSIELGDLDGSLERDVLIATGIGIVAGIAVFAYVTHQVRLALGAILEGSTFRHENYSRLRKVAFAILALIPLAWVTDTWVAFAEQDELDLKLGLPLGLLAGGILAFGIAEIYRAGIMLQEDIDFTI